jgi:hypothetical protein
MRTGKVKTRELTVQELTEALSRKGYTRGGRKKSLQKAATSMGLAIHEEKQEIKDGWLGKPKGLLQVCWEQGLLDPYVPSIESHYTLTGQRDVLWILMPDTSLTNLLGNCINFAEEETMLQSMVTKMGATID